MALFKINKGQKANLPSTYTEGYCYFTTDDGKFYIDTSNAAAGRILLNAGKADEITPTTSFTDSTVKCIGGGETLRFHTRISKTAAGIFTAPDNANAVIAFPRHGNSYQSQLGFNNNGTIYYRSFSNAEPFATATWKQIAFTSDNVASATKLATARTISLIGDVTGSATFDGSANASITATVADDSHNHVISNIDNLQTTLNQKAGNGYICSNLSPFTGNGLKVYLPEIHDGFYAANQRWTVTGSYSGASSGTYDNSTLARLFNHDYENYVTIPAGCTATFKIDFNGHFPGFPYGKLLINYYSTENPTTASTITVYCDWESQTVGEKVLTCNTLHSEGYTGNYTFIEAAYNEYYNIKYVVYTITAPSNAAVKVTGLEFIPNRGSNVSMPFVSKCKAETMYYPLTAPSFIGSGASLTSLNANNISSGTLAITRGGTGATTAQNACYAFLGALGTATAAPIDNTYYITQDINGNNTYHRRPASTLWTYIKGKTDSLYAASSHTHSYLPLSGGTITGNLTVGSNITTLTINGDWTNNSYLWFSEGGNSTVYGGYVAYGLDDKLHIGTRNNGDDIDALTISRGSSQVYINGGLAWNSNNLKYSLSGTTLTITTS